MSIKLSTKGRYGVRAMVDLAKRYGDGPVLVRSIAERQDISGKYLHALLASLKSAKLVRSVRGSGGGYALARAPDEVMLNEILEALEGPFSLVDCVLDQGVCNRSSHCAVREVWLELSREMEQRLSKLSLADLLERQELQDSENVFE